MIFTVFPNYPCHHRHWMSHLEVFRIFLNSNKLSLEIKNWIIDIGLNYLLDILFLLVFIVSHITYVNEVIL